MTFGRQNRFRPLSVVLLYPPVFSLRTHPTSSNCITVSPTTTVPDNQSKQIFAYLFCNFPRHFGTIRIRTAVPTICGGGGARAARRPAPCRRPCSLLAPWPSRAPFFCFFGPPKSPKMKFFLILFSKRFLDRFSTRFGYLLGPPNGSKIHLFGSFFESFVLALIWHRFFMFFLKFSIGAFSAKSDSTS